MEKRTYTHTLHPLHKLTHRLKFLSSLLYNPKFYRTIADVVGDPSKLDMTLGTLCYSTLFISAILKRYPQIRQTLLKLYTRILILLNKCFSLTLNKTKYKSYQVSMPKVSKDNEIQKQVPSEQLEKISATFKSFSSYLTDIRIFHRTFSIPSCIADILDSKEFLKDKDYLNFLSTWAISLYQPFETIAFLFDHNWLLPDRKTNNCLWWYAVSTRFWFFWVIAEFLQLSHKIICIQRGKNIEKEQFIGFIEHLATLPLCVHWSLEEGCLDDLYVGLFGTIAGGLSTFDMWKDVWRKIVSQRE